jgi:hypothetical protein
MFNPLFFSSLFIMAIGCGGSGGKSTQGELANPDADKNAKAKKEEGKVGKKDAKMESVNVHKVEFEAQLTPSALDEQKAEEMAPIPTQEFDFSSDNIDYKVLGVLPEATDVKSLIDVSGRIIAEMLTDMGVENINECSNSPKLTIGYLTWTRLNQLREDGFFGKSFVSFGPIRGIAQKLNGTVIYISNSLKGHRQTDVTLTHEITHYWWIRLCLDDIVTGESPEQFAVRAGDKMATLIGEDSKLGKKDAKLESANRYAAEVERQIAPSSIDE